MDIIHQIIERNQGFTITIAEIVVFTVFISLILYHLLIYFGRKNFTEGKLYLFFSLLLAGFLFYIFLDTNLYYITGALVINTYVWTTFFTGVSWAVIFFSFLKIMELLLPPGKEVIHVKQGLLIFCGVLPLWLCMALPPLTPFHQEIFRLMWLFTGIFIFFQIWNYLKLYNKTDNNNSEINIIFYGVLGFITYMWIYRVFLMNFPGRMELWIVNNILKITMAFTFALALARKFNREYSDLVTLKKSLEKKVDEKTYQLLWAKEKIENESRLRTDYFIQVAHETKTPLTLIGNYLHRLEKIQGSSHELQIVQHNFGLLRDTMILFLDSEKLEKGLVVYNHQQILSLSEFIQNKIPLYTEFAACNNLVFHARIAPGLMVNCDPLALERILNNLVENAIKFTKEGDIHLTLRKEDNYAILSISDSGPGIPASELPFVFERFYQGAASQNKGLGMGLFIVKKTLESLNGVVTADSWPDGGSTFTVKLPFSRESVITTETVENNHFRQPQLKTTFEANRKTILLVEDHPDMSAYLVSELNDTYNVLHATNGSDALDLLKTVTSLDLILSDVMMNRMSGYELFEALRHDPVYCVTPFIFITARSNHSEKIDYLNRGAVDYIFKPFSVDELQAKITTVLKNTEVQRKAGLSLAIQAINKHIEAPIVSSQEKWKVFEARVREFELTSRQVEVIREVEKGNDYRQIAETLHLSQKTIHRHVQILFEKIGVHNKIDLLKRLFE